MTDIDKGQKLIEQIKEFLEQKGFEPKLLKTRSACRFHHTYDKIQYTCYIIIEYDISMVKFYFIPPTIIQNKFLLPIAEYLTRANYRMTFGNFEMDFSDGEVSYRKIIRWREKIIQMEEVTDALNSGGSMWSMYLPGLTSILKDGVTPKEAITWLRG